MVQHLIYIQNYLWHRRLWDLSHLPRTQSASVRNQTLFGDKQEAYAVTAPGVTAQQPTRNFVHLWTQYNRSSSFLFWRQNQYNFNNYAKCNLESSVAPIVLQHTTPARRRHRDAFPIASSICAAPLWLHVLCRDRSNHNRFAGEPKHLVWGLLVFVNGQIGLIGFTWVLISSRDDVACKVLYSIMFTR